MSETSHFTADWLQLREPIDHRSRASTLEARLLPALPSTDRLSVLDLGSGCGSNLRHLAPVIGGPQHWTLLDHDPRLLDQALRTRPDLAALSLDTRCLDLAEPAGLGLARPDLVTASAWLDLVSAEWIDQFALQLRAWKSPVLIVLSVDGRRGFVDGTGSDRDDKDDDAMRRAFNQHQRQPKGLGASPALGPDAVQAMAERLSSDFHVELAASDWLLPAGSHDAQGLGLELLDGWAEAVAESKEAAKSPALSAWKAERRRAIERGQLGLRVGHQDLLALPRC